jgi:genome maintenance exonuclease 1
MLIEKFNYKPISRKQVDGKRLYSTPDGHAVPSVTTILDRTKTQEKRQALANWKKRVGEKQAQQISTEAANVGTVMHKFMEDYSRDGVLREPGSNMIQQQGHKMAKVIVDEAMSHMTETWGVEVPLYYPELYAGTTDCVGMWKGKPAIIDFKQTNKPKKDAWVDDYKIQLTAYANAHNAMFDTDISTGVILMCSRDFDFQIWEVEGEEFELYSNAWWDKVHEFYAS